MATSKRSRVCLGRLAALAGLAGCSAMVGSATTAPLTDAAADAREVAADAPGDVTDVPLVFDTGVPEDCATPFDDNGDGQANENCPCAVGAVQSCFPRPASQLVDPCRAGTQVCAPSGTWGACAGAWLPDAQGRCEVTERFADTQFTRRPVDVVWFVDTSRSMTAETAAVNANLNRFAAELARGGLDYRVIMIATRGAAALQVCVPAPLGGANCSDGPRFRHVPQAVGSTNGLSVLLSTYDRWQDVLRADTRRVIVAVTDDDSALSADAFDQQLRARPGWDGYVFNSIVGYESRADCPTLTRRGSVYLTLTERTMGQRARVCDADWTATFSAFAQTLTRRVISWSLAEAPRLDTLRVYLTEPGQPERQLLAGWSYDPATRALSVDSEVIPQQGSFVRVVYRAAALSP